ncbi:hypothetical protein O7634_05625 [Micromonospora sp. WMMD1120]|uniref:hypothetical protein n=1 Tax=Micromonospora sp. WMMD1120 TaxID=3016106 RepID=UPI0024167616|nr:hypothetical protein [Micromonospora sp. WMMD1120]MDG4806234.1 hypothetical protein [Micromonospora sp. WMMD1120]
MAYRTWGRLLLTALGVSVLAGAGQLGVAYGFGIVRLTGAFTGTTVNQWPAQLVWVGWFAGNAAVAGAVLTGRLARRDAPAPSTGRHLAIGAAAALGATVIAPLCMQPARAAELISVDPVWAVGICAMVGAVIGAGAAIAVLLRPELGWNMAAVAGAVWLLALLSVLPSLGTTGPLPTVRLGVLEPSGLDDDVAQRLALLLLPTVALLAGAATAGFARWRGETPLVSGATGVAGPVLVAFAYLTAGPGDGIDRYQATPYYGSLIAIVAGALGAAAAALLRWPLVARTADPKAIEPTAILRPLPAGPARPGASDDGDDDAQPGNAELATRAEPGGVVPAPWGERAGVRTVPAHWDWPTTGTGGEQGVTAAAPATPAAWLTAPTGEFTAAARTSSASRDEDVSSVDTALTGATAGPADATAGRTDAEAATADPGADEPTGSVAGTSGRRTSRRSATATAATGTATPTPDNPGSDRNDAVGSSAAATTGAVDTPPPVAPRRTRRPKAEPEATGSAPATEPPASALDQGTTADTTTSDATPTGRTRKASRPGKAAPEPADDRAAPSPDGTGTGGASAATTATGPAATTATASAATTVARSAATGSKRTAATPSTKRAAAGPAAAGPGTTPADLKRDTATTDGSAAAVAATPPQAQDDPAGAPGSSAPDAGTTQRGPAADTTTASSDPVSAADQASSTSESVPPSTATRTTEDSVIAGLFGVTTASDPDAAKWTPTPTVRPHTSGWTVPPQPSQPETPDEPAGHLPRPRHRAPLPDLSQAGTWNAFDTSRRGRRDAQDSAPASTGDTGPERQTASPGTANTSTAGNHDDSATATSGSATSTGAGTTTGGNGSAGNATGAGAGNAGSSGSTATSTTSNGTGSGASSGGPASTDATPAGSTDAVAAQPSRRGRLGGLFRRNRGRADEASAPTSDESEPLATQDEEFVDWVAGLSKPVSDNEPEQGNGRRSLRSSGRHHRD